VLQIEKQDIIRITIPRADRRDKPIYINGNPLTGTFKRFHEGDYRVTEAELKIMYGDALSTPKDLMELEKFTIDDIDKETLEDYRIAFRLNKGKGHKYNKLSDEEFLCNINALNRETGKLTMAGLLMFGVANRIVTEFPDYFLDYREIKDNKTERWSHRVISADGNYAGNIWSFFTKIVNRLTADIEVPFALNEKTMQRIDDTDVHKAVREALSNTLVHADYRESGTVVIIKGQDYFKFANPGNMRIPIEQALLGGQSDPRNAVLHQMFSYLGYGEKAGSGLPMILDVWKEKEWQEPEIEEDFNPNRTNLILYMKKDSNYQNNYQDNYQNNYQNNYTNQLNNTQNRILELIKENPKVTMEAMSEILQNITYNGVKWNIDKLKNIGIIRRHGTRGGEWIIQIPPEPPE
jgi:predicted HTH transcriptional regulator